MTSTSAFDIVWDRISRGGWTSGISFPPSQKAAVMAFSSLGKPLFWRILQACFKIIAFPFHQAKHERIFLRYSLCIWEGSWRQTPQNCRTHLTLLWALRGISQTSVDSASRKLSKLPIQRSYHLVVPAASTSGRMIFIFCVYPSLQFWGWQFVFWLNSLLTFSSLSFLLLWG